MKWRKETKPSGKLETPGETVSPYTFNLKGLTPKTFYISGTVAAPSF